MCPTKRHNKRDERDKRDKHDKRDKRDELASHLAAGNHGLDVASPLLRVDQAAATGLTHVVLTREVDQVRVDRRGIDVEHELLNRRVRRGS